MEKTNLENRYEILGILEVKNSNPNGNPDAGNMPRLDPITQKGKITDVCINNKIRRYVEILTKNEEGYNIYIKEGAVLNDIHKAAYEALGLTNAKSTSKEDKDLLKQFMLKNYFDIRTFGGVLSTGEHSCGQVRGALHFSIAESVDPIYPICLSLTRQAVTKKEDAEKERTFGEKWIVPYGVYIIKGYVSAEIAKRNGFSQEDLNLVINALLNMWDQDHTASRGEVNLRQLYVFQHSTALGDAPSYKVFDTVKVKRKEGVDVADCWDDYEVSFNDDNLPKSIKVDVYK